MEISTFDDLLRAARAQAEPQRLLFVFTAAGLPHDATAEQRADFQAGIGGELTPLTVVGKAPASLTGFEALLEESLAFAPEWAIVFAAALSGRDGHAPTDAEADAAMQRMVESVRIGSFGAFIAFDRQGLPLHFN